MNTIGERLIQLDCGKQWLLLFIQLVIFDTGKIQIHAERKGKAFW